MNLKLHDNSFIEVPKQAQFASYFNSAFKSREAIVVCYLENTGMAAEEEYLPKHKLPQCVDIFIWVSQYELLLYFSDLM